MGRGRMGTRCRRGGVAGIKRGEVWRSGRVARGGIIFRRHDGGLILILDKPLPAPSRKPNRTLPATLDLGWNFNFFSPFGGWSAGSRDGLIV